MTRVRSGPLIAATWLIGLGVVFLVRQALDLDWNEAWPLFVILVGVAGLVSTAVRGTRYGGLWSFTWPALWIVVGIVLLLSTTGRLGQSPLDLFAFWWPWVLVALGVWFLIGAIFPFGAKPPEELAIPLGGLTEGSVTIKFGAGDLLVGPAAPGNLVDGTYVGGVVHRERGPGRIELQQDTTYGLPWLDTRSDWTVGLATGIPIDLRLDTGAARGRLDLSNLRIRNLELHTGASETRIRLPRGAGATTVRAETGAASLVLEVPHGVGARIRSRMGLGSTNIDERLFPRTAGGFESADYATAGNRVDIDFQGGVGSIRVIGVE